MFLMHASTLSDEGLEAEIRKCEDTILRCREEAETRTAQAGMAESDGDSKSAMYYHQLAQVARDAAMIARSRIVDCRQTLAHRKSIKQYTVVVLCDGGEEVICLGSASSKSVAETNAFWACQEQMLRPVSAEAELVN